MKTRCRICGSSYPNLTSLTSNRYFLKKFEVLFKSIITNSRACGVMCNHCIDIISTMYLFYIHVQKTQKYLNQYPKQTHNYCRICGCAYQNLTSLLNNTVLRNHIYELFKVEITQQDILPTVICEPCFEIVNNNLKFYGQVRKAQDVFIDDCIQLRSPYYNEISDILENLPSTYDSVMIELNEDDYEQSTSVSNEDIKEMDNESNDDEETDTATEASFENITKRESHQKQLPYIGNTEASNNPVVNNDSLQSIKNDNLSMSSDISKSNDILMWRMVQKYNKVILRLRQLSGTLTGEFKCVCCNIPFKSTWEMFRHEREYFHVKYRELRCRKCSCLFDTKHCRASHKMLHRKIGDFKCNKCSKSFLHKAALNTHMMAHRIEFYYSCPICDLDFISLGELGEHGSMHCGEVHRKSYAYYCAVCGFGFQNRHQVSKHLFSHELQKDVKSLLNKRVN